MIFKTLRIHDFQSHKDTVLNLSPGINAIVGVTDSGKSGIYRALDWVCNNSPSSGSPSWWSKGRSRVELELDDGFAIARTKAKSGDDMNTYYLTDPEGRVSPFRAFRTDVPPDIQQVLNMGPLNWLGQHDHHFLLSDSSGEVARRLNEVANLSDIDTTISNIGSMIRQNFSQIHSLEENLKEQKQKAAGYGYLKELEDLVVQYETTTSRQTQIIEETEQIEALLKEYLAKTTLIQRAKNILRIRPEVEQLVNASNEQHKVRETMNELQGMIQEVEKGKDRVEELERYVETRKREFAEKMPDICPLCLQEIKK